MWFLFFSPFSIRFNLFVCFQCFFLLFVVQLFSKHVSIFYELNDFEAKLFRDRRIQLYWFCSLSKWNKTKQKCLALLWKLFSSNVCRRSNVWNYYEYNQNSSATQYNPLSICRIQIVSTVPTKLLHDKIMKNKWNAKCPVTYDYD